MSSEPDPMQAAPSGEATRTISTGEATPGSFIGPYKIIREIGEGGMGIVFHAQQTYPIRRDLALKIIKPGMDSRQVIARFESERQALALMDHPGIARVFDAGATPLGLPYFAMELVNGAPITEYCDSRRLSIRERIQILIPVCRAIQHAHQKGIIHRDIKPSNILVTEVDGKPAPKVIDFGLAKALGQQLSGATAMTNIGTVMGTLDYMSPEQADPGRQDTDTRSDVYSLGAVLYQLLTGTTPLEAGRRADSGYIETLQRVREGETERPSVRLRGSPSSAEIAALRQTDPQRLPDLLDGELDWITLKALDKERSRRYETVNGLARDLERYLNGEPVEAAPPSAVYRIRKFIRRHRASIAAASAFATLLLAGIIVTFWMAVRARRAEREAIRERDTATAVNDFLRNDLLGQASTENQMSGARPDPDLKVRTVLDRSAAQAGEQFARRPDLEAAVRVTIGAAYLDLGLYTEAAHELERAVNLRRQLLGPEHRETLTAVRELGRLYSEQGKYADAENLYTKLIASDRRVLGGADPETLQSMDTLASVYQKDGKYADAERLARQALETERRSLGLEQAITLGTMDTLASVYTEEGKYDKAEPLFLQSLEISRRKYGPDHPITISKMSDLAVLYSLEKRHAEAEDLKQKTIEAARRVLGPEHPYTLKAMSNLAVTYSDERKYAESQALNEKILEIMRRVLGPEHPSTLITMNNLGVAYKSNGKYAEAEALDAQVLASFQKTLGPNHPNTLAAQSNLALDYIYVGKPSQAESIFRDLLDRRRGTLGAQDPSTLRTQYNLALALYAERDYDGAEKMLRAELPVYLSTAPQSWERFRCESLLGAALLGERRFSEAEPLLISGANGLLQQEAHIAWFGRADPDTALRNVARLYRESGDAAAKASEWEGKLRSRGIKPQRR